MVSHPRVLLIGPELILGWTESTARALESLGCAVQTIVYNASRLRRGIRDIRGVASRRLALTLPQTPMWVQQLYAIWFSKLQARSMLQQARLFRPELILILKGESLQADTLQALKGATGARLAVWWVDHPLMNVESQHRWRLVLACIPVFDHCFIFDRSYDAMLRQAGARGLTYLPCAADPGIFAPQSLTPSERSAYAAAVSLVGVHTPSRERIIAALEHQPGLGVWGPGWREFFAARLNGAGQAFRGEGLSPGEACKVYNATPVNLNTHNPQTRIAGVNTRLFEILAAGAFALTDYVSQMEALLEPGREVAVYRKPEEAAEAARYYLQADEERRRMAEAGYRRVLGEHTYRHRMATVLGAL